MVEWLADSARTGEEQAVAVSEAARAVGGWVPDCLAAAALAVELAVGRVGARVAAAKAAAGMVGVLAAVWEAVTAAAKAS
jgi:hypothetical protein